MKTYDYINRVVITLLLSVYEGTWTKLSAWRGNNVYKKKSCIVDMKLFSGVIAEEVSA